MVPQPLAATVSWKSGLVDSEGWLLLAYGRIDMHAGLGEPSSFTLRE
jgi:hypothetical protein